MAFVGVHLIYPRSLWRAVLLTTKGIFLYTWVNLFVAQTTTKDGWYTMQCQQIGVHTAGTVTAYSMYYA